MKLFDSLTKKLNVLNKDELVSIYLCGPTVYDKPHIGNLRPIIVFDVLRNLLEFASYKVHFLHNITDIDDKIVDRAITTNVSEKDLASENVAHYLDLLEDLEIRVPIIRTVTNSLDIIGSFLEKLEDNSLIYHSNQTMYFDVAKSDYNYGILSGRGKTFDINHSNEDNDFKNDPRDFAVWKNVTKGVTYQSKFGKGRPGWHTECAALIDKEFESNTISIHGGGNDLKFPHHENERIQYLALNNVELAKTWFHVGVVLVDNKKMSKSSNNFIYADTFLEKYGKNVFRYLLIRTVYSAPISITDDLIKQALKWESKMKNALEKGFQEVLKINSKKTQLNNKIYSDFINAMENNLNTSVAFALIDNLAKLINKKLEVSSNFFTLKYLLLILGFSFELPNFDKTTSKKINEFVQIREKSEYTNLKDK